VTTASRGPGRSWSAWLRDPRLVVLALLASLVVFLVASSRHGSTPETAELPPPPYSHLALGRPDPTTAQAHIGDYLQVDVPSRPDDRYATVITQSAAPGTDVVNLISAPGDVPQLRAVAAGDTLVTVLLEPRCPTDARCTAFRQSVGAVRVVVGR
jgi:hypothetical protein